MKKERVAEDEATARGCASSTYLMMAKSFAGVIPAPQWFDAGLIIPAADETASGLCPFCIVRGGAVRPTWCSSSASAAMRLPADGMVAKFTRFGDVVGIRTLPCDGDAFLVLPTAKLIVAIFRSTHVL